MQYVRIYSDDAGESHFEDVDLALHPVVFAPPRRRFGFPRLPPAAVYGFLSSPPGWYGDWHPTPRRQMLFYLAGEIEAGSVTLVEDTTGRGHRSRVIGGGMCCWRRCSSPTRRQAAS